MSDFGKLNDPSSLGVKREYTSDKNSGSMSPKAGHYGVPNFNIKQDGSTAGNDLLNRSADIKQQLSQSFLGNSSPGSQKPQSRRNSAAQIKQENNEDEDDEDQGNERKRRDNINEKIQELLSLIPSGYFQECNNHEEDESGIKSTGTKDGKPNKGQILTKSVEYIQSLQNLIDENNRKEVELLLKLQRLKMQQQGKTNVPVSVGTTSAEVALGGIGVGPQAKGYFHKVLLEAAKNRMSE